MCARCSVATAPRGVRRSVLLLMPLCALLGACGGGPAQQAALQPAANPAQTGIDAAQDAALQSALSQVRSAQAPAGVETETWRALQDELARVLTTVGRAAAPANRSGYRRRHAADLCRGRTCAARGRRALGARPVPGR